MNAQQASTMYEQNWQPQFTNIEDLYERIKRIAKEGGYQLFINIDSRQQYNNVYSVLQSQGYDVEPYSDGKDSLLKVTWG